MNFYDSLDYYTWLIQLKPKINKDYNFRINLEINRMKKVLRGEIAGEPERVVKSKMND